MTPGYKVTLIDYGDEIAEVSWGRSSVVQSKKADRGQSRERERNIERSSRRAKGKLRQKVFASGIDHLLTLTYRYNQQEKESAWDHFEQFIRLIHKMYPGWVYIAVAERQKRGAYHFHMGVKGFQDVDLLRTLWRKAGGDGNIDVQYRRGEKGDKWKRVKLALYLTKYIGKEMTTELNERRFRTSLNIEVPKKTMMVSVVIDVKGYALFKLERIGGRVGFVWCPEESHGQYGWACSWG